MKNRKVISILLVLAMLVVLASTAGCNPTGDNSSSSSSSENSSEPASSGGEPSSETPTKDTLTLAGRDIVNFNIYKTTSLTDFVFDGLTIGECLFTMNNDFQYEPLLCKDYEESEDHLTFTFNLRDDVTFHNGQKMTSADVAYSIECAKSSPNCSDMTAYIDSVTTPDDYTVVVKLKSPFNKFLYYMSMFVAIVPDGIFESDYDFQSHPIGTGPYEFVSYIPGDKMILKAYENYYMPGLPNIPNIVYKIMTDPSTLTTAFQTGQLDALYVEAINYGLLKDDPNINIISYPTIRTEVAWMDETVAPFDDINVRLALNYAVDRDALVQIWGGPIGSAPAKSYMTPAVFGYSDTVPGYSYNIDLAKEYLAKSKYSGSQLSFEITVGGMGSKMLAEFMQESFRNIGVETTVNMVDGNTFSAGLKQKTIPFGISNLGIGLYGDMSAALYKTGASYNLYNYSNPEVDALYEQAAGSIDDQERLDCFAQINQILYNDAVSLDLLWLNQVFASTKQLDVTKAMSYTKGDLIMNMKYFKFN